MLAVYDITTMCLSLLLLLDIQSTHIVENCVGKEYPETQCMDAAMSCKYIKVSCGVQ